MRQIFSLKSLNNYNLKGKGLLKPSIFVSILILMAHNVVYSQSRGITVAGYHQIESNNITNLDEDAYLKIDKPHKFIMN